MNFDRCCLLSPIVSWALPCFNTALDFPMERASPAAESCRPRGLSLALVANDGCFIGFLANHCKIPINKPQLGSSSSLSSTGTPGEMWLPFYDGSLGTRSHCLPRHSSRVSGTYYIKGIIILNTKRKAGYTPMGKLFTKAHEGPWGREKGSCFIF